EHAKGNYFGFRFATKVLLPEALKDEPFTQKSPLNKKVHFYPSVKESIYLSQNPALLAALEEPKSTIYFRPEPWSAQYYDGPLNFFDEMLRLLAVDYPIVVLPRDKNQREHYQKPDFAGVTVPDGPLKLRDIVATCRLFIGAGGSMTRELAVLGVPVVSIYQADLLAVDEYLVDKGLLKVNPKIQYEEIKSMLNGQSDQSADRSVLQAGQDSYALILNTINNLTK
ncbi:MAG: DUF354 domain-containing protein, partial [Bacteroidota bacterium]